MAQENSQPTQPATQQVFDVRRIGQNNSGLNDGDISDVICILHPATPTAINVVEQAANTRPQHVLFRTSLDSLNGTFEDIEEQETFIIGNGDRAGRNSGAGADLALRTSSAKTLQYKHLGFIFGRNVNSCDIVFSQDASKRISNQHFRIYPNEEGILMIEDMSTNGTIVDDVLLRCKDPRFNNARMLSSGSIICIQNANDTEMMRWVVRIPSRRVNNAELFHDNLRGFIDFCRPGGNSDNAVKRVTKPYVGPMMKWDGGERYSIVGMLGKGAFATVYQIATKMNGRLFAAKELERRRFAKNGQLEQKIMNEIEIMKDLDHPSIVKFIEVHEHGDYLYIIMEFVRHGDLQTYLTHGGLMKEPVARTMALQVLNALHHLHRRDITHRDIKPENLLIAEIDPFKVKLADFGLSKIIKNEETMLKTFCGTLLYCAPEVFPDFGGGRGTKRRRGQRVPYSSSVDVWSFAGVMWYAMCGQPPFKGVQDGTGTGEAMYKNIMATPLDPSPLRRLGVSEECIDLLTNMLLTDPEDRFTAPECLRHQWLKDDLVQPPADYALGSIVEEDEAEPAEQQLSQLSLHASQVFHESDEEEETGDVVLDDDEFTDMMQPAKRPRTDPLFPRNQIRDGDDSSANPSFHSGHAGGEDESFRIVPTPGRPRLFGEIGQSAFQSSGILNAHANDALSYEASIAPAPRGEVPQDQEGYTSGGAEIHSSAALGQFDGHFSSPSLHGAEIMVRDLRMASPQSPISRTQSPAMPATPRTPDMIQHNSLDQGSNDPSQISEPTPKARPALVDRQINLPQTASYYYDPLDPSTHNLEYASKVSGVDFLASKRRAEAGASAYGDTLTGSNASSRSNLSAFAAAAPFASTALPSMPTKLDFQPPLRRLGKLTATPDSFAPGLAIPIEQSKTSWGRLQSSTVVYEDSRDIRIPKTAFTVFFYSSKEGSEERVNELAKQGKDWTGLDDLHVGICTHATRGISINGKPLTMRDDKGRAIFGHVHSGDVVQVYQDARSTECLKFKCEFYLGSGKEPRLVGKDFTTQSWAKDRSG